MSTQKNFVVKGGITAAGNVTAPAFKGVADSALTAPFSGITGKPTTLAGFGITDANTAAPVQSVAGRTGAVVLAAADVSGLAPSATTDTTNAANIASGTLPTARLPALTGDATSIAGTAALTLASVVTPGTAPKVTFDAKGRVTASSALLSSDIPNLDYSKITTGRPNSLAGYGITDAVAASQVGVASGVASLDASGRLTTAQIPAALVGALQYQGVWNASTNTPTLVSSTGIKGQYYKVAVAGSIALDGLTQWNVGDMVVFDGTTWDKIDGLSSEVTSVAGRVGAVVLAAADISGLAASATTDTTNAANITAGTLPAARLPAHTGDATSVAGSAALTLAASGVTAGTFGSATQVPAVTVDAKGRVTNVVNTPITPAFASITGKPTTLAGYGVTDAVVNTVAGRSGAVVLAAADVSGLASSATVDTTNAANIASGTLPSARLPALTGDVTSAVGTAALTLATSGVTAGTYGSATQTPVATVDAKGRVTGVVNTTITPAFANITGKPTTLAGYGITDGASNASVNIKRQQFTAVQGDTTYTVAGGYTAGYIDVYLNGLKQRNGIDVTVTSGTNIVFTAPLSVGDEVETVVDMVASVANTYDQATIDAKLSSGGGKRQNFVANHNDTTYTVAGGYAVGFLDVYGNGLKMKSGVDFTATDGSTVVFTSPLSAGTDVEIVTFGIFNVANTYDQATIDAKSSTLQYRNRLINGGFQIDQRLGTLVYAVPNVVGFIADRWILNSSLANRIRGVREANTSVPGSIACGFVDNGTTPSTTLAAADYAYLCHRIEGVNVSDFAWGTAAAKPIAVSFWQYFTQAGTYSGAIQNSDNTRSYPFTFTVASANTWNKVSLTVPGCTDGVWKTDFGSGVWLLFNLGNGGTFLGPAGAWAAANYIGVPGTVQLMGLATAQSMRFTQVQLELGTVATTFEQRPYGIEMALCQRYFYPSIDVFFGQYREAGGQSYTSIRHPVVMRVPPTITLGSVGYANSSALGILTTSIYSLVLQLTTTNVGYGYTQANYTASAEL